MKKFFLLLLFLIFILPVFAQEAKLLNYDKKNKTIKVEVEGKEYELTVPVEDISMQEEKDSALTGGVSKKKKQYAKGPASTRIGSRLYNIPTDSLLSRNGIGFDFTHRFSAPIKGETSNEVYGLDSYAYTGLGLYYGITNNLEAHAFRTSLADASEIGLKYQMFKEAKKFGDGAPFGLTLSGGFQNDSIQNSIDPYVQGIFSKVIIPNWLKIYLVPTWADQSSTIGMSNSLSATFFTFLDPKRREYQKSGGTFALPIGAAVQIIPNKLSIFGEYSPVLAGYKEVKSGWAFGLQILSRLETHAWTIGVSNVPYSTFGQFIVGGPSDSLHFGFNISARIK